MLPEPIGLDEIQANVEGYNRSEPQENNICGHFFTSLTSSQVKKFFHA